MSPLLTVEGLTVAFPGVQAVRGASFTLDRGECLAIVGESGSGKSVTARSLVGLAGDRASVKATTLDFDGTDLTGLDERGWRRIRGGRIGLVLQDALVSLDPLRTVGAEITEALRVHRDVPRAAVHDEVVELLTRVGVPEPEVRAGQYPHQLSGGLRQRALIASALAGRPELLIADEPTTALDVTVQARILELLDRLKAEGTALLLISHDLAVVSRLADRVAVMYGGLLVEEGPTREVLDGPRHPYTRALAAAVPSAAARGTRLAPVRHSGPPAGPDGCPFAERCAHADDVCRDTPPPPAPLRCHHPESGPVARAVFIGPEGVFIGPGGRALDEPGAVPPARGAYGTTPGAPDPRAVGHGVSLSGIGDTLLTVTDVTKRYGGREVVRGVSLRVDRGEALGIVGESGSGKTTVARIVLGLAKPDSGSVTFAGEPWSALPERRRRPLRRRIQTIVQDPLGSFDPRHDTGTLLGEALAFAGVPRRERRARALELLERVELPASVAGRRPAELSGGQRQRIAIARALAPEPELLVCDEPVSALDASVQAQILDLLTELRSALALSLLFISHDLGVIHHISDRVAVMKDGEVVETGEATSLLAAPSHPYSRELFAAIPALTRADA
ncbi:ABC transporter ATP-binding protein [Actinocorallia sp. API 0066]|uniref:dipeptide ABC transporter ATP-binding protein n=1 Tax=Actinocorallia sp. API 0066 TaxID=2896846 RepID=UPI001E634BE5|nr:ABC transporter ATP-binding protein [Actinocorallia sp. API 0066]MCD0449829.1 ABC transporter ATP-binding protein [Actinocorallia sp. API 0066]